MLKKGTLPQVIDYYATNVKCKGEFTRALGTFFDQKIRSGGTIEMHDGDDKLFDEWFIFDFCLRSGKTILQDFYDRNPLGLENEWHEIYRNLQKYEFGLFDVKRVVAGTSAELESVKSGTSYTVFEHTATFTIQEGSTIVCRVGWAGTHYEIIGGFVDDWPLEICAEDRARFREGASMFGLKEYRILREHIRNDADDEESEDELDREIAFHMLRPIGDLKGEIDKLLAHYGALPYVSADLIEEWIRDTEVDRENETGEHFLFATLTVGLCEDREGKNDKEKIMLHMAPLLTGLYTRTPQKYFGGKTPAERTSTDEGTEKPPKFFTKLFDFSRNEWAECSERALKYFHAHKNEKALAEMNRALTLLFEKCTTYREVFRLYGNKAMMHFALGEEEHGREMLRIALALNAHYDFAQMTLESYERGGLKEMIELGGIRKVFGAVEKATSKRSRGKRMSVPRIRNSSLLKNDIGVRYYSFLKKLRINFNHALDSETKITVSKPGIGSRKIGRDDPCPCSSGKKYEKCHGV